MNHLKMMIVAILLSISTTAFAGELSSVTINVDRITKLENPAGKVMAFADITLGGAIILRDLRIVNGANGLFVSFPSIQGADGKYYSNMWISDETVRTKMQETVLAAYSKQK